MKNLRDLLTLAPYVIGIAILLNLFIYQGMEVVYPSISYDDFCGLEDKSLAEPARFDQVTGQELTFSTEEITEFENMCIDEGGKYEQPRTPGGLGYCDYNYTCNQERQDAERDRALVMLVVLIAFGTMSLIFARKAKSRGVELGLAYGGVFMLISTLGQLWQVGSQAVQLVAILLGLGLLLFFASKRTDLN